MSDEQMIQDNQIKEIEKNIKEMLTEMFGDCIEQDGVMRTMADHMGVVDAKVFVEAMLESGFRKDAPYGVLHFHCTFAENIPDEVVPNLLISLNELNHVINAGAFPGFGCFCYYAPLKQIYLSYRMPVNLLKIDAEYDNIRYYLGSLYDQMDILVDFIIFAITNPEGMNINAYLEYLDEVSDLDNLTERLNAIEREIDDYEKASKTSEAASDKNND